MPPSTGHGRCRVDPGPEEGGPRPAGGHVPPHPHREPRNPSIAGWDGNAVRWAGGSQAYPGSQGDRGRAHRDTIYGLTRSSRTGSPELRQLSHRTIEKRRDVAEETGRGGQEGHKGGPGPGANPPRKRPAKTPPRKRDSDHTLARLRRSIPGTKWAEGVPRRVLPEVQGKASDEGDPGGHHDHDPPIVVGEVDLGLAPLAEEA